MALRLRRDVSKASYYVWFLGAEEARGLRGPRVINPIVPYLIERSREQEPLKVTLQVSHKGIKILQGSSKHFIPHSAITSSVQIDDIVACVLLLYNPATKCPLHVHAYRCDSETTAEALNQQLQILINRPENQKRFMELEARLGIVQNAAKPDSSTDHKRQPRHKESSPKRFESSLGSDTGTSTRESECSEENMSSSPMSPGHKQKGDLFDSLAAELRAKLNGNGPPLLLPPRDYDTVHRSKGNLAAIELRRCQNRLIVGATKGSSKQVSSRGSSGIGSDLAPSPDRQNEHSSSEEENWSNEADSSVVAVNSSQAKLPMEIRHSEDNYIADMPPSKYKRPTSRERLQYNKQMWSMEDEIRPIIMRPPDYDMKFKRVLMDKQYSDEKLDETRISKEMELNTVKAQNQRYCKYNDSKKQILNDTRKPEHNKPEKIEQAFKSKLSLNARRCDAPEYDFDSEEEIVHQQENLTDKQKYLEAYSRKEKIREMKSSNSKSRDIEENDAMEQNQRRYFVSPERERQRYADHHKLTTSKEYSKYDEKNPYKKPDNLPYRESIEKMMKSPVMRYKSFEENSRRTNYPKEHMERPNYRDSQAMVERSASNSQVRYEPERSYAGKKQLCNTSPDSSLNISPKDRFHDAKEKFRAMERMKLATEQNIQNSIDLQRRGSLDVVDMPIESKYENWSDEEQFFERDPREIRRQYRKSGKRQQQPPQEEFYPRISNAKSLSNLAKGYRHSYAEPRAALPRNSGRVGLAAVNPF